MNYIKGSGRQNRYFLIRAKVSYRVTGKAGDKPYRVHSIPTTPYMK